MRQIYTPVVWKIRVPPKIHICLWLLSNKMLLTIDNLVKRRRLNNRHVFFVPSMSLPFTCSLTVVLLGSCGLTLLKSWNYL
jgi:hypothetical protein